MFEHILVACFKVYFTVHTLETIIDFMSPYDTGISLSQDDKHVITCSSESQLLKLQALYNDEGLFATNLAVLLNALKVVMRN
jgi:hypothetical protein